MLWFVKSILHSGEKERHFCGSNKHTNVNFSITKSISLFQVRYPGNLHNF